MHTFASSSDGDSATAFSVVTFSFPPQIIRYADPASNFVVFVSTICVYVYRTRMMYHIENMLLILYISDIYSMITIHVNWWSDPKISCKLHDNFIRKGTDVNIRHYSVAALRNELGQISFYTFVVKQVLRHCYGPRLGGNSAPQPNVKNSYYGGQCFPESPLRNTQYRIKLALYTLSWVLHSWPYPLFTTAQHAICSTRWEVIYILCCRHRTVIHLIHSWMRSKEEERGES